MVDLVIPYVNGKDKVWQKSIDEYIKKHRAIENRFGTRFNDIGLFPLQLKLVSKYMPFINTIHILVSNIEQLDGIELPSNAKVVLHKDFIPQEHLPTFNSTTIEMFLWNIPNLADRFIYANDDMLPIAPLKESDFYSPSGKVRISWFINDISKCTSQFRQVCYQQYQEIKDLVINDDHNHQFSHEHYFRPLHSMTPMIREHCKETYEKLEHYIKHRITPFRTRFNHNQYIYPLYELLCLKNTLESKIDFVYCEMKLDSDEVIQKLNEKHQIICINDNRMSMLRKINEKEIHRLLEERL